MPFKKGDPRPPGSGRAKGTVNKRTAFTVDLITDLLSEYQDSGKLSADFALLEPKDRIQIAERLMGYVLPRKQAVQSEVTIDSHRKTIEDTLLKLADQNNR